jgi:uncharacterized protein (TIGR03435 family)
VLSFLSLCSVTILIPVISFGQDTPRTQLEVSSVKASAPDTLMSIAPQLRNGTLTATNVTLRQVVESAYGVTGPRIIAPDWLDRYRFDIRARASSGALAGDMRTLLQELLMERFKLVAHTELRETATYNLVVGKGGVKMSLYPDGPQESSEAPRYSGGLSFRGTGTMEQLAKILSRIAGRSVVDKTGLAGRYNFFVTYTALLDQVADFAPPDIFRAIQEQLGLRLQPSREQLETIVVDHIERTPTDN